MHFRYLKAADLQTGGELPAFLGWLEQVQPNETAILLLAPAGSGKAAAVGRLAERRRQDVVLSSLVELLEQPDAERQLQHLLLLCESQRNTVLYLDRLDGLLQGWDQRHPETAGRLAETFRAWLAGAKARLAANSCLLVASGRDVAYVPPALRAAFDRTLALA